MRIEGMQYMRPCENNNNLNQVCFHQLKGNVLKELVEPNGVIFFTKTASAGRSNNQHIGTLGSRISGKLCYCMSKKDASLFQNIADRERCPVNFVGTVTRDGKVVLSELPVQSSGTV